MGKIQSLLNIAIFASGNGSNAENIIRYFRSHTEYGMEVALVVCNKPDAYVLKRAAALGVPTKIVLAEDIRNESVVLPLLNDFHIDAIVLAGFLLMVPDFIVDRYSGKILNIHPSLLPKYGGRGMYGRRVHEAVVAAGERVTGITVHNVTAECDEGAIVFQASVAISPGDTSQTVEANVHELERLHFPRVIAETFQKLRSD